MFEGLGIALIEAQASGLRCFTSLDVVPKESKITDLVEYISLDKDQKYWADRIMIYSTGYLRENTQNKILESGYDINDASKWLQEFYLNEYDNSR